MALIRCVCMCGGRCAAVCHGCGSAQTSVINGSGTRNLLFVSRPSFFPPFPASSSYHPIHSLMAQATNYTPNVDEDLALALQLAAMDEHHDHLIQTEIFDETHDSVDEDEDLYDDIHVSPPSRKKSIKSPTTNKSKSKKGSRLSSDKLPFAKIVQPVVDRPSKSLTFPLEVLGLVCLHLSQATLRHCVSLVCKSWNAVSDQYIRRMGVWSPWSDDYERYLLEHMKRLDTLECWFKADPELPNTGTSLITHNDTRRAWERFQKAILTPLEENADQDQGDGHNESRRTCLLHYIERLSLRGHYLNFNDTLVPMMHEFRFLKSLKIEVRTGIMDLRLFDLLDNSPKLLEIVVRVPNYETINILSGDADDEIPEPPEEVIDPETAHFPVKPKVILPPKDFPDRYHLRVFHVDRVLIRQHVLERIFTTCNDLRVFKATQIHTDKYFSIVGHRHIKIDEKRVMEYAKKCCPRLEWFTLTKRYLSTDETHLDWVAAHFPDTKFLSLTCVVDSVGDPSALAILPNITVLEITQPYSGYFQSPNMHKLLCNMPNLLHLDASQVSLVTDYIYQPPQIDWATFDDSTYIKNNRTRKNKEREGKREQRKKALQRFQRGNTDSTDSTDTPSDVWACRNLRTLRIRLSGTISHWAQYVERNVLLRSLTELRITCSSLYMGQRKEFPDAVKQRHKALEESKMSRKPGFQLKKAERELVEPERYQNDLWPLRGLRSLEFLCIEATTVNGMLHSSDFEFLRKRSSETVVYFNAKNDTTDDTPRDRYGFALPGIPKETIWPHLQAFHIRYSRSSIGQKLTAIIPGMEDIRPGVQFSIKQWNSVIAPL